MHLTRDKQELISNLTYSSANDQEKINFDTFCKLILLMQMKLFDSEQQ